MPLSGSVDDLYIRQDEFRAVFAADVPEEVAELMAVARMIDEAARETTR